MRVPRGRRTSHRYTSHAKCKGITMTLKLRPGDKFSCIALENIAVDDSLSAPVVLGDGLWVTPSSPFRLDSKWREWVGKTTSDRFTNVNQFLVAIQNSKKPHILDDENTQLSHRVGLLFHGILLQGIPDYVNGWTLTGARVSDEIQIRSLGNLHGYYNSPSPDRVLICEKVCQMANRFVDGWTKIESSSDYSYLKRGMRAVISGMRREWVDDRLHEYVRALEALIKPRIGKSTTQFVHRCQTFALANRDNTKTLKESYNIRGAVEHMHHPDQALANYPQSNRESVLFHRLRQIEKLTFEVYLKICTSPSHATFFKTDNDIESFWRKRDHDRYRAWGARLDLRRIR